MRADTDPSSIALQLAALGSEAVQRILELGEQEGQLAAADADYVLQAVSDALASGALEGKNGVSRHDIAGIWVAFFSRCQRYRCQQAKAGLNSIKYLAGAGKPSTGGARGGAKAKPQPAARAKPTVR